MSNAYLCPILQQNQFTDNANFLAGGLIWSYVAGTTTPQAVYTDSTAATAWPNPIVLDQRGETGGEIWLAAGQTYKFVLEEAPYYGQTNGVVVSTFDNVNGVNDATIDQTSPNWIAYSGTPTYISSTSFSVTGDQTLIFQEARRLKTTNTSGTKYSTIVSATYGTGITTIVVRNDPGDSLDSGLSAVSYGFIETDPASIPVTPNLAITWTAPQIFTSEQETQTSASIVAGGLTLNCSNANVFTVTMDANISSITFSNVPVSGVAYAMTLIFTADGTARTVTWSGSIAWENGTAPTLTSTLGKRDVFVLLTYDAGTTWLAYVAAQNQ